MSEEQRDASEGRADGLGTAASGGDGPGTDGVDGRGPDSGRPGPGRAGTGGGVVVGGSMTGGAVATGEYGRATDASRTTGPTPPTPANPALPLFPPPAAVPSVPPGGVVIGGHLTGGAVATGAGGHAEHRAERVDPRYQSLLAAVELLYGHLPLLVQDPENDALRSTLDQVRQDITTAGHVSPGRLQRLRDQLTMGNSALTALTSAVAVAEAVRGLLA